MEPLNYFRILSKIMRFSIKYVEAPQKYIQRETRKKNDIVKENEMRFDISLLPRESNFVLPSETQLN